MNAALQAVFDDLLLRFTDGDPLALLYALQFAARYQVPAPEWTAQPLGEALRKYGTGEAESLEAALGIERPPGFRISKHREKFAFDVDNPNDWPLLATVEDLMRARLAAGDSLTAASECVALEVHKEPRTVRNWWHEADAMRAAIDRDALKRDPANNIARVRLRLRELRADAEDLAAAVEQAATEFDTDADNIRRWCFGTA